MIDRDSFHRIVLQMTEPQGFPSSPYPEPHNIGPVELIFKGWIAPKIEFEDPRDGKSYEWEWKNERERLKAIEEANALLRKLKKREEKYLWDEVRSKPAGVWSPVETSYYVPNPFDPWGFSVILRPTGRGKNHDDFWNRQCRITNKELYLLKEEMPAPEFIARFNKTLLDYVLERRKYEEKLGIPRDKSKWIEPLEAIRDWGDEKGISWDEVEGFVDFGSLQKPVKPRTKPGKPFRQQAKELFQRLDGNPDYQIEPEHQVILDNEKSLKPLRSEYMFKVRRMDKNYPVILESLFERMKNEDQTNGISVQEFLKITGVSSPYFQPYILRSFLWRCNNSRGNLKAKCKGFTVAKKEGLFLSNIPEPGLFLIKRKN